MRLPPIKAIAIVVMTISIIHGSTANAENFYAGKTISIIVGFGPGGAYDLYARLLARYLGKYIPGHPAVVVQNMDGAGGIRAANYVYNNAPKDGTTIAAVNQGITIFQQLGGKGVQYDPTKIQWLGRLSAANNLIYTSTASGVKTLEDAKLRNVTLAGSGVISDANIYPKITNALLGTRFKIINGYSGTSESNLAIDRGEVDGRGGGSLPSILGMRPEWIKDKFIRILVQIGFEKDPDIDAPLLIDLVQNERDKQIVNIVTLPVALGINYWCAPGAPDDRVSILSAAVEEAAHDPDLLEDARKGSLVVRYASGVAIRAMIARVESFPEPVIKETAKILEW